MIALLAALQEDWQAFNYPQLDGNCSRRGE
jgi:hypothetical protein